LDFSQRGGKRPARTEARYRRHRRLLEFSARPRHDGHQGEKSMSKTMFAAAAFAGLALAQPAAAELLTHKDLTADTAVTMEQTAVNTGKAQGQNVSATVVGRAGEVIVQIRGDGAGMHTFENSFRKAWTARSFKSPSGAMEDRLKANPNLPLIHLTNVI